MPVDHLVSPATAACPHHPGVFSPEPGLSKSYSQKRRLASGPPSLQGSPRWPVVRSARPGPALLVGSSSP